jgi:15-cis-phytoene synthase
VLARRSPPDPTLAEARSTTRRVARTFALACRLLPAHVRGDVYRLYLVFRTLDDAVDERWPGAEARIEAVERWARGGPAESREARLLAEIEERHPLPREALLDFCLGMRDDLLERPVASESDLDEYCYRVAGTVGVVMAAVRGSRAPAVREAAALGMAMQRTNVLRDIEEDRARGRVYLPREALERHGPAGPVGEERLVREQIARADELYDEGLAGIRKLACGRRAVRAAAVMYREILREIERDGYGRSRRRVVVPRRRRLALAARHGVLAR